jgi:hypothetical protein
MKAPTYWKSITKEGNGFYTETAQATILKLEAGELPEKLILNFLSLNIKFVDSTIGLDADASAKEVQNKVVEFLTTLFTPYGYTEEDIIQRWQTSFY